MTLTFCWEWHKWQQRARENCDSGANLNFNSGECKKVNKPVGKVKLLFAPGRPWRRRRKLSNWPPLRVTFATCVYLSTRYTPFFGRPLKIGRKRKNKPVGVHGETLCPSGRSRTHNPHNSVSDDFDAVMVVSLRGRSMDTPAGTRDRFSLPLDRGTRTTRTAVDTRSDTTARQQHYVLGICPPVNYFTRLSSAAILCTTEKWTAVLSPQRPWCIAQHLFAATPRQSHLTACHESGRGFILQSGLCTQVFLFARLE